MCTYYRKGNKSFAEECGLENPNGIEDRWAMSIKRLDCINDGRATFKTLFYVGSSINHHEYEHEYEYFHLIHCRFWSNWMLHYSPRLICPSPVTHLISSVDFLFSSSPLLTKCFPLFPCLYLFLLRWPNVPLLQIVVQTTGTIQRILQHQKIQSSKNFSRGLLVVMKLLTTNGPGRCLKTKIMMDSRTCHHDHMFMFCNRSGRPFHRRRLVLRRVPHLWRVGDDGSSLCRWCQLLWHHGWEKDIRMDGKSSLMRKVTFNR